MQEVIKRNFEAMSQGLKSQRAETDKLKQDSKAKDARISQLESQIISMNQRLSIVFAKSMGSGATT